MCKPNLSEHGDVSDKNERHANCKDYWEMPTLTTVKVVREITIVRCLPQYESAKNAPRRGLR